MALQKSGRSAGILDVICMMRGLLIRQHSDTFMHAPTYHVPIHHHRSVFVLGPVCVVWGGKWDHYTPSYLHIIIIIVTLH